MSIKKKKRKKITSKGRRKITREKLKSIGRRNRQFLKLTCRICKREYKIRVNDKAIYTEEVRKNWTCLSCD